MAVAALFKLRWSSRVARRQRTRRLGVASGEAKGRFNGCNEGHGGSACGQTPKG